MLAPFFSEPQEQSAYPADTWAYLNSAQKGAASQASRRKRLLAEWLGAGRFPPLDSPQSKPKIALLTSTDAADKKLNMDLLSERAAMLADVRDEVAIMKSVARRDPSRDQSLSLTVRDQAELIIRDLMA
jgi:hypothetical protein